MYTACMNILTLLITIAHFDTTTRRYLHVFNMNQITFKVVVNSPGNNRIGMKQYCQPIEAGIFITLHVTCSV